MRLNVLEWPCLTHLSYFALRDTFVTLWISCPPKYVMWQRVIRGTGEFKVRNLIQGTGWEIYLRWLSELASAADNQNWVYDFLLSDWLTQNQNIV